METHFNFMETTCAICYGDLSHSEPSFTSECHHLFHPCCVSGVPRCPSSLSLSTTCRRGPWRHTPFFTPSGYAPRLPLPPVRIKNINPFPLAPPPSMCAACHSFSRDGDAIFKAECHHTFHLTCVTGSVCPVCTMRWAYDVSHYDYDDDEPLEPLEDWDVDVHDAADGGGKLVLDTHCEHAAVARGKPHDNFAVLVHAKAAAETYSFIENQLADSFAQCMGGLPSVAVQEAWISVDIAHPKVRVQTVKSGRYKSNVEAYGRKAWVDVGELHAEEEMRFLVLLHVPKAGEADYVTRLLMVTCTYRDTATGRLVTVPGEDVAVMRPMEVAKDHQKPNTEVAREKFRVEENSGPAAEVAAADR